MFPLWKQQKWSELKLNSSNNRVESLSKHISFSTTKKGALQHFELHPFFSLSALERNPWVPLSTVLYQFNTEPDCEVIHTVRTSYFIWMYTHIVVLWNTNMIPHTKKITTAFFQYSVTHQYLHWAEPFERLLYAHFCCASEQLWSCEWLNLLLSQGRGAASSLYLISQRGGKHAGLFHISVVPTRSAETEQL